MEHDQSNLDYFTLINYIVVVKNRGQNLTFSQRISEFLIRFFYPSRSSSPVHFKNTLHKASRVLVSCKTADPPAVGIISMISDLFPRKGTVVIIEQPGDKTGSTKLENVKVKPFYLGPVKDSLFHLSRNERLNSLLAHRFDLFIDLDPEFNLLTCYLARRLNAPVRIGFKKEASARYYNLEYNGVSKTYLKNLEGLLHFMKGLL